MYGFIPSIKELTVADKVVRYSKEKKQFEISVNKKYFMDWAIALFLISVIMFLVIPLPLMFWSMIVGCITLIIPVLFILAGIRFFYLAGNDDRKIIIDDTKKVIVYSASMAIPFNSIRKLSKTETDILTVKNKFRIKKHKGWEISVEDHKGNKAPLLKSENEEKIKLILKEFSLLMDVKAG
jgi:hypothetical protein